MLIVYAGVLEGKFVSTPRESHALRGNMDFDVQKTMMIRIEMKFEMHTCL
jgi:hypothetical protein